MPSGELRCFGRPPLHQFRSYLGNRKVEEKYNTEEKNKTTDNIDDASKALNLHSKRFYILNM